MSDDRQNRHIVDLLFVIALLFMFAFSVLMLIAIGASVYRRNVEVMADNYDSRISYAYVTEKLRQADSNGNITIGGIGGCPALIIKNNDGAASTLTYLYSYENNLMELTTLEDNDSYIGPEAGQVITALDSFEIRQINDSLIRLDLTRTDGSVTPLYLSVISEEGGS